MLIRVDLGFHYLVVLVVVVVVLPVIGFVVRRKFRYAAARREEIKRLLVLASEEAARAEQEGTEGYYYTVTPTASSASVSNSFPVFNSASVPLDSSPKPQYQCAVCFCPTTTRCAKCKAVRYCSGRCQIVHWRQGHKDECRPYVALNPINVVGGSSYTQRDGKIFNFSVDTKDQQTATPVERSADNLHQSDNVVVESLTHRRGTNSKFESTSDSSYNGYSDFSTSTKSSVEESRSDVSQLADATSVHFETIKQEHQTLASPAKKSTSSGKINQNRSDLNDEDSSSGSSSSSCCTDYGSNKSSFSDPSTTSSSFWDGTIPSKKSSIDELDDIAPNMTDYRPSSSFSLDTTKSDFNIALKNGFIATSIISNGSGPTALGSKKSNDETTSSKKLFNEGLKSTESKISLSGSASHRASAIVGRSKIKDAKAYGGMPSSSPERSNHVFDNSVTSHTSKFMEVDSSLSKVSDARLTSSTSKHASRSTNTVKVDELTENSRSVRNGLRESMLKVTCQLKPSTLTRHGSLVEVSETGHKYSCKGIFSYEMFVKLYNWKIVELQPCGLVNIGNSCYANAVLQCLAYTPPLTAYLLQGLHSKACKKREWCFTCEFEALVQKAKYGNSPLSPIRILSQIENIGRNLGPGRQEDAHEFLRYAIDTWQSVCLKEVGTNAFNSLEEETTLIGLTFGGHLRSQIKCMKCGGKSEQHERMMDLTVEIGGDIGTLEEALNKFTCTEILDGENKYKCSRCKSYEKAKKKLTLLDAPNVLTIALKRFQYGKFGKLNKSIRFPEILDMAPYVSGTSDKSPIYRLYGVVVHLDVMNAAFSGHYVCYVKNVQNRWFKIDDSMVTEVDLQSVLTKGAYLLLYARCSPRAPRSIRSSSIHHHDPRKHKLPSSFMSRPDSTEPWNSCNDHLTKIRHRSLEEESSSSSDNSGIFSESCSCSTESSSHRDWSSIEDHMFDDWEHDRNMNSNSSDSDTSSSSFPSPLGIRERRSMSGKNCRNLGCISNSNSCRITNFDRLGLRPTNPFESSKSGVTFKRSTIRGRSD